MELESRIRILSPSAIVGFPDDGIFDRPSYEFFQSPLGSLNTWSISSVAPEESLPTISLD